MTDESPRQRLPFEPAKNRKKPPKKPAETPTPAAKADPPSADKASSSIPEVVSRRMIRRMGVFCGIPTALGISTFIVSYLIVSNEWFRLPNSAVVLLSMGCFGLGVIGLSYGVLSASWDEENPGSLLGWQEFTTNFGRMREAWRSAKSKS